MGKKIGLVSLGCPKNLVDSEVMLGLAREAGHDLTADPRQADVLVVNTCAFIESAKRESVEAILEMAGHKRDGRCRQLIVAGCLAERYRAELQREIPEIDAVLGTSEVPAIVAALEGGIATATAHATFHRGRTIAPRSSLRFQPEDQGSCDHATPAWLYDADTPRVLATPGHYAYLKVAEGCDHKCSFCIIPKLRGAYRSRSRESVVEEAVRLARRGVKELLLISQDTTFYGLDRGERGALARLLRQLDAVDGLRWIRLLYLYPTTIDDDTLAAIAESEKVCRYIDLPLQHASSAILRRMQRPGTATSYRRLLDRIRARIPGVSLRSTFIVGFPGESERDVDELVRFVRDVRFDHLGVFTYSHEEGTAAHRLADDVPARAKRQRRQRVMAAQKRIVIETNRDRVGSRADVLVDGRAPEHELVLKGRLQWQAPEIDSVVYLDECAPTDFEPGDFVTATITATRDYDLLARPVSRG